MPNRNIWTSRIFHGGRRRNSNNVDVQKAFWTFNRKCLDVVGLLLFVCCMIGDCPTRSRHHAAKKNAMKKQKALRSPSKSQKMVVSERLQALTEVADDLQLDGAAREIFLELSKCSWACQRYYVRGSENTKDITTNSFICSFVCSPVRSFNC